jgi:hypothetical protein
MLTIDKHSFSPGERAKRRSDYIERQKRELREGIEVIDGYVQLLEKASSLDHELTAEERRDFEQATLDINSSVPEGMTNSDGYVSYQNFNRAGIMAYLIQDYASVRRRLKEAVEQGKELDQDFYDEVESLLYIGMLSQNELLEDIDDYHTDDPDSHAPKLLTLSEIAQELDECDIHFEVGEFKERYGFVLKSDQTTKQDIVEALAKQMARRLYSKLLEVDSDLKEENEYEVIDELYQRIMHAANMEEGEAESNESEEMNIGERLAFNWGRELKEVADDTNPGILHMILRSRMSEGEQLIFDYFSLRRMSEDKEGVEKRLREEFGEDKAEEIMSDLRGNGIQKQLEIILDSWYDQNIVSYQEHIKAGLESLPEIRVRYESELENLRENGHKAPGKIREPWTTEKKVSAVAAAILAGAVLTMGSLLGYHAIKGSPKISGTIRGVPVDIYEHNGDEDPEIVESRGETFVSPDFRKNHPLVSWRLGAREMTPGEQMFFRGKYRALARDKVRKEIVKAYKKDLEEAKKRGEKPDSFEKWALARPKVLEYIADPIATLNK